jgi:hypothetical protein
MRARRNLHGFRPMRNNPIALTIVKFLHSTILMLFSSLAAHCRLRLRETDATDACWRRAEALPEGRARQRQQQHLVEVVS